MSLDLYEKETAERMMGLQPVQTPEASAFDGFARGTGQYTMRSFATAGRALSMAGAAVPVVIDAVTGGTELQDKYFQWHDDVFGSAVDYWTPRPNEVGSAGQIVGTMLGTIPLVIASPAAAVAATQLSVTEDLARQGVEPTKAIGVGAVQGFGLGLGIYVPIFGKSLWQRTLVGGAGFNVVQGAAMRGASGAILEGTPAEEQFKAFDSEAMTLDLLLGAAFGAVSHLSPAQRAEGERAWNKLAEWGQTLKPSDVEGLAVLRQAQHANVDSLPGKPVEVTDVTAHTDRLKTAIEQLLRDEPVNVDNLPAGRFEPVPERFPEAEARAQTLMAEAERIRVEEGLPSIEVYHGSPYDFERFDITKIGTGEGAQAFGHGLYFAESPEVAGQYQQLVKQITIDGAPIAATGTRGTILRTIARGWDNAKKFFDEYIRDSEDQEQIQEWQQALRETEGKKVEINDSGNLYRVELKADTKDFLDWDKPLSEQPTVMAVLRESDLPGFGRKSMGWRGVSDEMWEKAMARHSGEKFYRDTGEGMSQADTSELLQKLGIPGIRYLDQGSRGAGEGTRNFVLFDANQARILDKNGKPVTPKPEGPPVRTEPPLGEGLARPSDRKRVDQMTVEEMRTALLTDPLTGIKNKVAFEEFPSMPVIGSIDADSLKWVNDNLGHQAGNEMLRAIAKTLSDETEHAFRFHGDEFAIGAKTTEEANAVMERAVKRLQDAEIEATLPDGSKIKMKGVKLSYGIGKTEAEADYGLGLHKTQREQAGLRAPRGVEPPGIVREPPARYPDQGRPAPERDPLALEAQRFATENPDLPISVGRDANGNPITKTVREYLDETRAEASLARQDISLFEIAASCILGAM